jgi:galactose oxidase
MKNPPRTSTISGLTAAYLLFLLSCNQQLTHSFVPHEHNIAKPTEARAPSTVLFADRPESERAMAAAKSVQGRSRSQIGQWSPVFETPALAIHACELPDGTVMMHDGKLQHDTDGEIAEETGPTNVMIYNIRTRQLLRRQNAPHNLFCGAQTILKNGNLGAYSGDIRGDAAGHRRATVYDWKKQTFQPLPNMLAGSWYGTAVELSSGEVAVLGGGDERGLFGNARPQVLSADQSDWYEANMRLPYRTINESYYSRVFWDETDALWAVGNHSTTFKMRFNGRPLGQPLNPRAPGDVEVVSDKDGFFREYSSATEFMTGVVWLGGGGVPPSETTVLQYIGKVNAHEPGDWEHHTPMWFARRHQNAASLPDGSILVGGGVRKDHYAKADLIKNPELWTPSTGTWTMLAPETIGRTYHSTGWLAADGLWWSCGGNIRSGQESENPENGAGNQRNCQVFTPPQRFMPFSDSLAPTPTITTGGDVIGLGEAGGVFELGIGNVYASQITSAALIPLGCTTHAYTTPSYRRTARVVSRNDQTQSVKFQLETTNPAVMRPGYYKLFVMYQQSGANYQTWGEAKIVQIVNE